MALIEKVPKDEKFVFCGDLVDRGPKSRDVVEYVKSNGHDCVTGNHEDFMASEGRRLLDGKSGVFGNIWMNNGGVDCIKSYGYWSPFWESQGIDIFKQHITWMENLPLFLEYPDVKNKDGQHLLITHTSASKVWHWEKDRRETQAHLFREHLIWSRHKQIQAIPDIYNVFGHTPKPYGAIVKNCYANIDTGCYIRTKSGEYGTLTALQFPEMKIFTQKNIDGLTVPSSRGYT